jgi:hypothetical protein
MEIPKETDSFYKAASARKGFVPAEDLATNDSDPDTETIDDKVISYKPPEKEQITVTPRGPAYYFKQKHNTIMPQTPEKDSPPKPRKDIGGVSYTEYMRKYMQEKKLNTTERMFALT